MSGKISALMGKTQSPLLLGVLNGLLPCGLSFGAASLAISYAAMADKLGFMLLFGVGTLPVLLLVYYLPRDPLLNKWRLNSSYLPRLLVVMGLLVIIRSSGLGIPYLSPAFNVEENKLECCE
jgi:sulfite exporter TauE/SafE